MKSKDWKAQLILLLVVVNKVVSSANFPTQPRQFSNGGALASVLKLRGAEERQQPPPTTTFWGQLRERFTREGGSPPSGDQSGSIVVLDHRSNRHCMSAVARALTNGLMQSGARVRRTGLLALLAVACILSVVGAATGGGVAQPWRGWQRSAPKLPAVVVETSAEDVADGDISSTSGKGSSSSERRYRLLKTPRFPLAYMPWWKALQDRRNVSGTAGELCTTKYGGTFFQRAMLHMQRRRYRVSLGCLPYSPCFRLHSSLQV